ncbi:hypothetical protein K501DRAFT_236440 [Backusella circina FSU 941]|nr:hypothetical protein K501DRAFT_236440 [Backusella circina FSU 941]
MPSFSDNLFLLATVVLSFVAWVIAFGGACAMRRYLSGGAWWIVVYELFLLLGHGYVFITNSYAHYRLVILSFLVASISMLTFQIDSAVASSGVLKAAGALAAGYIILIIIQFLWIIVLGSDPQSELGKFGPAHPSNLVGVIGTQQHQQQPHQQPQYEMTADKTIVNDPIPTTNHSHEQAPVPPTEIPQTDAVGSASPEYREKVQALHAYQANPEDPNELSFDKGETLEIVDRNGNWWQARKADGTVGIIPSNYFP